MWWREESPPIREQATSRDVTAINRLFSEAFTERYRKDGMPTIRVPNLTPDVWKFAIELAGEGAFVWRDSRPGLAAFNIVHQCGSEGWMGPIAVRLDRQGHGLGREIVTAGIAHLQARGVRTIGLETMPRTIDNIGFYSRLGFRPGPLTITLLAPSAAADYTLPSYNAMPVAAHPTILQECSTLSGRLWAGREYAREIALTCRARQGDTLLLYRQSRLIGFLLYHTAALVDGQRPEELRILKLVAVDQDAAHMLIVAARGAAQAHGLPHVTIRCQGGEADLYAGLVSRGWRIHWSDLRMTLTGFPDVKCDGVGISNWEI